MAEIARELEVDADEIDVDAPVTELGIDSTTAIVLSTCLEDRLGRSLAPGLLWEHPTIADLARHLTGEHAGSRRRGGAQNSK